MPRVGAIGHIALTVTDVQRSALWYANVFGATSIVRDSTGGHDMDVLAGENLLIGLHKHAHTSPDDRFDEGRVGLDHAAILCEDLAALDEWRDHLDELGVEHSGIEESSFGAHINFKDPDGIALEVHSPPQQ